MCLYGLIISQVPVFSPAIFANSILHIYLILLFLEVMRKVFKEGCLNGSCLKI